MARFAVVGERLAKRSARPQQVSHADANPQQGRQLRTISDFFAVARKQPAAAGGHATDALAWWRKAAWGGTHPCSQASSDIWALGCVQAWRVTGAQESAAVAATGPSLGLKH